MESEVKMITTLKLEPSEAKWLRSVMQNPLWDTDPEDESMDDKKKRCNFFEAVGGTKFE